MTTAPVPALSRTERRRRLALVLLRSSAITAVLVGVYYVCSLDRQTDVPPGGSPAMGLAALVAVAGYQVRAIARSSRPASRAVEALSATAPLFLLLFATGYFLMAAAGGSNFNLHTLTRTDSLYFTVTVFAIVGFGDINPTSQAARMLVTVQMILDLIVLGLGIRVFTSAVQSGRQRSNSRSQEG